MATVKSDLITTLDATTPTLADNAIFNGKVRAQIATYTAAGALALNTIVLMNRVPVEARILRIMFASDDLGTGGLFDIGFYKPTGEGGAVIVADAIADDVDVKAAAVAQVNKRFTILDINGGGKKVWELAGLSAKPNYAFIDIAITVAEATTAAGDFHLIVEFVQMGE